MRRNRFLPFLRRRESQSRVLLSSFILANETPYSRRVHDTFTKWLGGNYEELKMPDPKEYSDWRSFKHDYACYSLFRKGDFFKFTNIPSRDEAAFQKFIESEQVCEAVNSLFSGGGLPSVSKSSEEVRAVLFTARNKIRSLLGPFSWDLASQYFRFGPGATYRSSRSEGDAYYKFGLRPTTTASCYSASLCALRSCQPWLFHLMDKFKAGSHELLEVVPGNRVVTVPKDSNVDRVIAIEPLMNLWVQFGIGGLIRKRLRRVGIDLNDQTLNQDLARQGSIDGSLCTIDLSSASDTISLNLVEALLPEDWFSAIRLCRSPRGVMPDGRVITYQKVSSMGNGFTFELESLIFWALCASVQSQTMDHGRISVYGDDIILPSTLYGKSVEVLNFCGFKVNTKKSFADGPFRESCGKHYFRGYDVTPLYVKHDLNSDFELLRFANRVFSYSHRGFLWGRDGAYREVWEKAVGSLDRKIARLSSFEELGDIGVFRDFDEAKPQFCPNLQSLYTEGAVPVPKRRKPSDVQYLLKSLFQLDRRHGAPSEADNSVISNVRGYRPKRVYTRQWPTIGSWIS